MSKPSFTPGPWEVDNGDSALWGIFSGDDGDGIAYLCEPNGRLLRVGQAEANARLIAASPALYAALQQNLSWLSSYPGNGAEKAYDAARAALKLVEAPDA